MNESVVLQYALLGVAAGKSDTLFRRNYLTGLTVLGLYELEEAGLMPPSLEPLPKELSYLSPLLKAAADGNSMDMVLTSVFTHWGDALAEETEKALIDRGFATETVHKGIFGIQTRRLTADSAAADACRKNLLTATPDQEAILLTWVLEKTGLLEDCLGKEPAQELRRSLTAPKNVSVCKTLERADQIYDIALAVLATFSLT